MERALPPFVCCYGSYTLPIYKKKPGVDICVSTRDLSAVEIELSHEAGREYILKELLEAIQSKSDWMVIDIPVLAEFLVIQGMTKLFAIIDKVQLRLNKHLTIEGILVTQFDKRIVLDRDVLDMVSANFPNKVFKTVIRKNIALAEAPTQGVDIFEYHPESTGAEDYIRLSKEIIKVEKNNLIS